MGRKVLGNLPKTELERFLVELANASLTDTDRIFRLYSQFLAKPPRTPMESAPLLPMFCRYWAERGKSLPTDPERYRSGIIAGMRDSLGIIWTAQDEYSAEWRLFRLRSEAKRVMALSDEAPLFQALAYLRRQLRKLKKCANPACAKPFFIAARSDRRCCDQLKCVEAVQAANMSRWWDRKKKLDQGEQTQGERVVNICKTDSREISGPRMPASAVEAFVVDVANVDDREVNDGTLYLFSRYPQFFPTRDADIDEVVEPFKRTGVRPERLGMDVPVMYHRMIIKDLRYGLRAAWQARDRTTAERYIFETQYELHVVIAVRSRQNWDLQPPSLQIPIHQALRWVRENLPKLRKCANDDCPRPFFVATGKRRFCSEPCANVGRKKSKRDWWKKNRAKGKRARQTS